MESMGPFGLTNGYKEGILDMLASKSGHTQPQNHFAPMQRQNPILDDRLNPYATLSQHSNHIKEQPVNGLNGLNGMDHMSKFFTDLYKNGQKQSDLLFGVCI